MCSGIFVFEPRPVLALNFDFNRTFRLTYENGESFCMRIRFGEVNGRPLGVHKDGRTANIQITQFRKAAQYRNDLSDAVYIPDLVDLILDKGGSVQDIPAFVQAHTLQYSPANTGIHCLFTDRSGAACIAEPGVPCLTNRDFPDYYISFTNFSLSNHLPLGQNMEKIKCSRYLTIRRMMSEKRTGADALFEVLQAVRQTSGSMPTIFSMVAEPEEGVIRFVLDGDFSRRYRFSFSDQTIRTESGFRAMRQEKLTSAGIQASDLKNW